MNNIEILMCLKVVCVLVVMLIEFSTVINIVPAGTPPLFSTAFLLVESDLSNDITV